MNMTPENMPLIMASIKLQSDILMHLQKNLRLNHEAALDTACEIIHLMMQSGTVIPELVEAYEGVDTDGEEYGNNTLQDLPGQV